MKNLLFYSVQLQVQKVSVRMKKTKFQLQTFILRTDTMYHFSVSDYNINLINNTASYIVSILII